MWRERPPGEVKKKERDVKKKNERYYNVNSAKDRDPGLEAAITELSEKMIRKYGPELCYSLSLELQKKCWEDYDYAVKSLQEQ